MNLKRKKNKKKFNLIVVSLCFKYLTQKACFYYLKCEIKFYL